MDRRVEESSSIGKLAAVSLLAVLLVLAGCSSGASTSTAGSATNTSPNAGEDGTPSKTETSTGSATETESAAVERMVGVQAGPGRWNRGGNIVHLAGTNVTWRSELADNYFGVSTLDNGTVLAAFLDEGRQQCGQFKSPCPRTGFQIIDPKPEPRVVYEWSFPLAENPDGEVHDVERLPSGEFLLVDMEHERVLTVENGEITWEWYGSEFYEAPPNPAAVDWLHINDVDHIGGDRYLVSMRNANQLLVVERGTGVVEVINEDTDDSDDDSCRRDEPKHREQLVDQDGDGDVRCGDPSILNHQHNPQWLGDGIVLVADSHNNRVVELVRSEDGDWEVGWSLEGAGGVDFSWPRDADRLPNGNTLVTDTLNGRVVEVTENGTIVWQYETADKPYEADRLPEGETVGGRAYSSTSGEGNASLARPAGDRSERNEAPHGEAPAAPRVYVR